MPGKECPPECRERLAVLETKISGVQKDYENTHDDLILLMDKIRKDYRIVICAIIGLAGAIIGVKRVGSPLIVDILAVISAFSGFFVLSFVILEWRQLHWWKRIMMVSFSLFVMVSTFTRLLIFKSGIEPAPAWYPYFIDISLILICITMIIGVWRYRWH